MSASVACWSKATDTVSVWPSITGTRLHAAPTFTGWNSIAPFRKVPRIFCVSFSIFSSSPPMKGITLPRMSSEGTPG